MNSLFRFLFFIFLALAVYGFKLSFMPLDFYRVLYFLALPVFLAAILPGSKVMGGFNMPNEWLLLIFFTFVSFAYSVLVLLYSGTEDLTFLRMHIDYIITFAVVCPLVYYMFFRSSASHKKLIKIIIYLVSFQASVMVLMLVFPKLQSFIFTFIDTNGAHERFKGDYRFRAIGLTGFASYSMAVCQSFGMFLFFYLWRFEQSKHEFILSVALFLLVLVSSILSARTSFLFIVPFVIIGLFFALVFPLKVMRRKIKNIFLISLFLFSLLLVTFSSIESEGARRLWSWAFELVINLFESGELTTASTESLKTLFFMPDMNTFLFGDGRYISEDGSYYMNTDVGYLRIDLYGGLFGSLLFYLPFIYLFFLLYKWKRVVFGRLLASAFLAFSAIVFVVNIKGSIFFDAFVMLKLFSIYTFSFIMITKYNQGAVRPSHIG